MSTTIPCGETHWFDAPVASISHHKRLADALARGFGSWADSKRAAFDVLAWEGDISGCGRWDSGDGDYHRCVAGSNGRCSIGERNLKRFWNVSYVPDAGRYWDRELHIVEVAGSSPITKDRLEKVMAWAKQFDHMGEVTILHVVPVFGPVTSVEVTGLWSADAAGIDLNAHLFGMPMNFEAASYVRSAHAEIVRIVEILQGRRAVNQLAATAA